MALHKSLAVGDIHIPYQWTYASQSARESASGFEAGDVGKLARQTDDNTLWMLIATTPTWVAVGGGGGGSDAERLTLTVRKGSGGTINKGQAVYVSGYDEENDWVEVELAKADSASTMPAVGIANGSITDSADGEIVVVGLVQDMDTSGFSPVAAVYVSAATAGALTATRPTGATSKIQKVGIVLHPDGSAGTLLVIGAGRINDVPNLATDKTWRGDSDGVASEVIDFGVRLQQAESAGESSTDLTGFQQKLRITMPAGTPAGKYRIGWSYQWRATGGVADDWRGQVQIDDSTVIHNHQQEVSKDLPTDQMYQNGGFAYVDLTAASHTIDLDWCSANSNLTAYISKARLEVWRVE